MLSSLETRVCSKCNKVLPLTEEYFSRNQSTNTGGNKYFRPECKECTKKASQGKASQGKAKAYKLAGKPKYPELGTPCYNCGRTDKKLVFDHDHETLEHRGWLCDNCNRSIGMLGDTIESLYRTIQYLERRNIHD